MNPTRISDIDRFLVIFPSIVYEALPFIIIGALISGVLEELLPQQTFAKLIPKRRWLAIAGSALLGLIFPMCECGIVPVMRRLLGKGLPLGCAVAYMLAAPIINPVVIGSTWAAFSGDRSLETGGDGLTSTQMVSLRVGLGFITAFTVGVIVNRREKRLGLDSLIRPVKVTHDPHMHKLEEQLEEQGQEQAIAHSPCEHEHHHHDHAHCDHDHHHHGHDHEHCDHAHEHEHVELAPGQALTMAAEKESKRITVTQPRPWSQRLMNISETALHDFVDITCFLILGAIIASVVQTFRLVDRVEVISTNPFLAAPAMMILAVLLCLCSEADAFVAANLIKIPLAGKIAFLVLGPMLDLKLYLMYTRVFRTRLIWTIVPCVFVIVFILSVIAHLLSEWQP
jgi:uncharacterized membrane protein YraQ (UPF0718 family)